MANRLEKNIGQHIQLLKEDFLFFLVIIEANGGTTWTSVALANYPDMKSTLYEQRKCTKIINTNKMLIPTIKSFCVTENKWPVIKCIEYAKKKTSET
jgi:hypothetical protein